MINTIAKRVSKKFLNSLSEEGLKEFEKIREYYVKTKNVEKSIKLETFAYDLMKKIYSALLANRDQELEDIIFDGDKDKLPSQEELLDIIADEYRLFPPPVRKDGPIAKAYEAYVCISDCFYDLIFISEYSIYFVSECMNELKAEISK